MKSKTKDFDQHFHHEINDEEKAEEYLEQALPLIGKVVMYFNGLESELDSFLCEWFTDSTDSMGLVVMGSMSYTAKVNLLKRLSDDLHIMLQASIVGYQKIITDLNECARLRNMVAHADWESMNEDAYTFVKTKISKAGLQQEYVQFTKGSLEKIVALINTTRNQLGEFRENKNDLLSCWG